MANANGNSADDPSMLHGELTSRIIEARFEVAREMGVGFLERVYQKALKVALEKKGLSVGIEIPLHVYFRGQQVGYFGWWNDACSSNSSLYARFCRNIRHR